MLHKNEGKIVCIGRFLCVLETCRGGNAHFCGRGEKIEKKKKNSKMRGKACKKIECEMIHKCCFFFFFFVEVKEVIYFLFPL